MITDSGKKDALNKDQRLYTYLTPGATGCALSHLNVCNKIIHEMKDDEYALILEDDVTLADDLLNKINDVMKQIPSFDMLYVGYSGKNDSVIIENTIYGKPSRVYGLYGYYR